jgi:hypothetical protein
VLFGPLSHFCMRKSVKSTFYIYLSIYSCMQQHTLTWLTTEWSTRDRFSAEGENFIFTTTPEPVLGSSNPPTQWVRYVIFPATRRAAPEANDVLSNLRCRVLLVFKHVFTVRAWMQIQLVTGHVFFTACLFFSSVALRPNAGHGLLVLKVSRSHITTHHSR